MNQPTEKEIEDVIQWAEANEGKHYGMTYEQGIKDALLWIIGNGDRPDGEEDGD